MSHQIEEGSSGSDSDDGLDEDMEALRKACSVTGVVNDLPESSTAEADNDAAYESENEDIQLLRRIEQRFSVPSTGIASDQQPIHMRPLSTILPSGLLEDDEDDDDDHVDEFETLRAIERRFSQYNDSMKNNTESSLQRSEQVRATNIDLEKESSTKFFVKRVNNGQGFPDCVDGRATNQNLDSTSKISPDIPIANVSERHEPGSELVPATDSSFPRSARAFVEAIKKNRTCQKFIRGKMVQLEAQMAENKKLRERVTVLKDFQLACRRRTGRALSQKKDPRIQLISVPKQRGNSKAKDKSTNAIYQGPPENSHVVHYRNAMSKYPFSLIREPWSKEEKENLMKGIKQQFQETLMQNLFSAGDVDSHYLDSMLAKIKDHEISPEEIRLFLPQVNWENLSSMYLKGRSGPECESRWLNCEDPLINRQPWSVQEDKKLLYIVQNQGYSNWIDIAGVLGTNRTPFQCLSRFQRSLNASIIKNEWTAADDEELRNAVAEYGDTNWQLVASALEGRTGTQCSNRWKKSLNPLRERVGKWSPDEDVRLKISVNLFGAKNWNKIARFVPGRTQVQCRERWVNSLDPSLNMNAWTEEEDLKLKEAIAEHGYSWSKIAACIPPRTDSQCRRRWKVLLPHEVPMLQAAKQLKKAALISNFVDREAERPALSASDFVAPQLIDSAPKAKPSQPKRVSAKPNRTKQVSQDESSVVPKAKRNQTKRATQNGSGAAPKATGTSTKSRKRRLPPEHHEHDSSSGLLLPPEHHEHDASSRLQLLPEHQEHDSSSGLLRLPEHHEHDASSRLMLPPEHHEHDSSSGLLLLPEHREHDSSSVVLPPPEHTLSVSDFVAPQLINSDPKAEANQPKRVSAKSNRTRRVSAKSNRTKRVSQDESSAAPKASGTSTKNRKRRLSPEHHENNSSSGLLLLPEHREHDSSSGLLRLPEHHEHDASLRLMLRPEHREHDSSSGLLPLPEHLEHDSTSVVLPPPEHTLSVSDFVAPQLINLAPKAEPNQPNHPKRVSAKANRTKRVSQNESSAAPKAKRNQAKQATATQNGSGVAPKASGTSTKNRKRRLPAEHHEHDSSSGLLRLPEHREHDSSSGLLPPPEHREHDSSSVVLPPPEHHEHASGLPLEHHEHDSSYGGVLIRSRRARKVTHTAKALELANGDNNGRSKKQRPSSENKSSSSLGDAGLPDSSNGGGARKFGTKNNPAGKLQGGGKSGDAEVDGHLEARSCGLAFIDVAEAVQVSGEEGEERSMCIGATEAKKGRNKAMKSGVGVKRKGEEETRVYSRAKKRKLEQ